MFDPGDGGVPCFTSAWRVPLIFITQSSTHILTKTLLLLRCIVAAAPACSTMARARLAQCSALTSLKTLSSARIRRAAGLGQQAWRGTTLRGAYVDYGPEGFICGIRNFLILTRSFSLCLLTCALTRKSTEIIYYPTSNNITDMFPPRVWDVDNLTEYCEATYGVTPRPNWILEEFGAGNISRSASRIIFSNGLLDPVCLFVCFYVVFCVSFC